MPDVIRIDGRAIEEGAPPYMVCEAEINHNGDLDKARAMVRAARRCGADAIKFQLIVADNIADPASPYYALFKRVELSKEDFAVIKREADLAGISCFATVPDRDTAHWVRELGFPAVKIGSTNITNLPLLKAVGEIGVPVILSTGMSSIEEVREALDRIGHREVILLHCTVGYPIGREEVNLRMMGHLRDAFPGYHVGFSDHTQGWLAAALAASHGARVIEKHFTLDKRDEGPDHHFSSDPDEMRELIENVQGAEAVMGRYEKGPTRRELKMLRAVRRYVVAAREIKAGARLTEAALTLKRIDPAIEGIEPRHLPSLAGRRLRVGLRSGEAVTYDMLEDG